MSKKKIKPCPFCGATAEYSDEMGAIMCSGCGFYFECPTTLDDALATWNMRGGEIIPKKPKMVRVKPKRNHNHAHQGKGGGEMSEMCRYVSTCGAYLMRGKEAIKKRADVCPKNTNSKCEIIPKKPKMVRVKAWACKSERGVGNIFAYDLAIERNRVQVPCEVVMLKTDYDKIRRKL